MLKDFIAMLSRCWDFRSKLLMQVCFKTVKNFVDNFCLRFDQDYEGRDSTVILFSQFQPNIMRLRDVFIPAVIARISPQGWQGVSHPLYLHHRYSLCVEILSWRKLEVIRVGLPISIFVSSLKSKFSTFSPSYPKNI